MRFYGPLDLAEYGAADTILLHEMMHRLQAEESLRTYAAVAAAMAGDKGFVRSMQQQARGYWGERAEKLEARRQGVVTQFHAILSKGKRSAH